MPYTIKKQGSKWVKINKETGKVVSHHDTKEKAEASVRAYYANAHECCMKYKDFFKDLLTEETSEKPQPDLNKEIDLPEVGFLLFKEKIDKLNKKASRWKVDPMKIVIIRQENRGYKYDTNKKMDVPVKDGDKPEFFIKHTIFKLEGNPPKVEGFEFIAKIDHTLTNDKMVLISPSASVKVIPDQIRNANQKCDICKTNRDRNNTFILKKIGDGTIDTKDGKEQHKDGDLIVVGSACLKRFLNKLSIVSLLGYAEYLKLILEEVEKSSNSSHVGDGRSVRSTRHFDAREVIEAFCKVYIFEGRYISKTKSQSTQNTENPQASTTSSAHYMLLPDPQSVQDKTSYYNKVLSSSNVAASYEKMTDNFMSWLNSKNFDIDIQKNINTQYYDFFKNIKVIADQIKSSDSFPEKYINFVGAIFGMFIRDTVQFPAKQQTQIKKNEFIGKVGEKINLLNVKLQYQPKSFESRGFGYKASPVTTYLLTFLTDDGNTITWWQPYVPDQIDSSDLTKKYNIKNVTVKDHKSYNGINQTVIKGSKATIVEPVS